MKRVAFLLLCTFLSAKELSITGTVISNNQKMIGARYMGYVKKIYFDIGDKVKREDTLYELESAEFDILKNQAELALEQAEIMVDMYRTRLDNIRREKRRAKLNNNIASIKDLEIAAENAEAGLAATKALVKSATVKIKQVATISDYLKVKAPNDGIIVQKRIRVGDLIAPGMLTMVLVDLKHLEIDAQIAESDLLKVKEGAKVKISIPAIHHRTIGYVKTIVPSANPLSHTFTLIVRFNKDNKLIYPGMYAKLSIEYKEPKEDQSAIDDFESNDY